MRYQRFWAGNTIGQWAQIATARYGGTREAIQFMESERNDFNMTSLHGQEFAAKVIRQLKKEAQS